MNKSDKTCLMMVIAWVALPVMAGAFCLGIGVLASISNDIQRARHTPAAQLSLPAPSPTARARSDSASVDPMLLGICHNIVKRQLPSSAEFYGSWLDDPCYKGISTAEGEYTVLGKAETAREDVYQYYCLFDKIAGTTSWKLADYDITKAAY
jgi:hypothetical protein